MVTNLFVQRQLNYVQSQVVEQDFPEMLMASGAFLPIATEIPSGAQSYSYKLLTFVGSAAILANAADDLPLVNAYAEERIGRVRTLANAYEYTLEDMESAQFAGTNVDSQMAVGAREVMERQFDLRGYDGDSEFDLLGLLNHPNVPSYTVPNDGTGSATAWSTKTAELIYRDLRDFVSETRIATNGVETPEAIAMPQEQFDIIVGTPYPTNSASGETILSFFLKTQRATPSGVQSVFPAPYLAGKGAGGTDIMVSYRKRADKVKLHMPLDFEMLPVQERNMCYRIPCRMRTGGVQVTKPLSIRYASGI
jgi:hypothetical protein